MNWKQLKAISAAGALSMAMLATGVAQNTPAGNSAQAPATTTTDSNAPAKGHMRGMEQLNLTDQQKAQVNTILRSYQPTAGPLIREVVTERRALRDAIRAQTIDETAIRAQVAKVASLEADLAVQRAHIAHDIRAVLTPEQIQKLKNMQTAADARVDGLLQRIANSIATD